MIERLWTARPARAALAHLACPWADALRWCLGSRGAVCSAGLTSSRFAHQKAETLPRSALLVFEPPLVPFSNATHDPAPRRPSVIFYDTTTQQSKSDEPCHARPRTASQLHPAYAGNLLVRWRPRRAAAAAKGKTARLTRRHARRHATTQTRSSHLHAKNTHEAARAARAQHRLLRPARCFFFLSHPGQGTRRPWPRSNLPRFPIKMVMWTEEEAQTRPP
jgi:hypothetical protein